MNKSGKLLLFTIFSALVFSNMIFSDDKPFTLDSFKLVFSEDEISEDYIFTRIIDFDVDETGNMYFLDPEERTVKVYNKKGKYLFGFGKQGEGPGEFRNPFKIKVITDGIIIADTGKNHFFSRNGKIIKTFQLPKRIYANDICGSHLMSGTKHDYNSGMIKFYISSLDGSESRKLSKNPIQQLSSGSERQSLSVNLISYRSAFTPKCELYWCRNDEYLIYKWNGKENVKAITGKILREKLSKKTHHEISEMFTMRGYKAPELPEYAPVITNIWYNRGKVYTYLHSDYFKGIEVFDSSGNLIAQHSFNFEDKVILKKKIINNQFYVLEYAQDDGIRRLHSLGL